MGGVSVVVSHRTDGKEWRPEPPTQRADSAVVSPRATPAGGSDQVCDGTYEAYAPGRRLSLLPAATAAAAAGDPAAERFVADTAFVEMAAAADAAADADADASSEASSGADRSALVGWLNRQVRGLADGDDGDDGDDVLAVATWSTVADDESSTSSAIWASSSSGGGLDDAIVVPAALGTEGTEGTEGAFSTDGVDGFMCAKHAFCAACSQGENKVRSGARFIVVSPPSLPCGRPRTRAPTRTASEPAVPAIAIAIASRRAPRRSQLAHPSGRTGRRPFWTPSPPNITPGLTAIPTAAATHCRRRPGTVVAPMGEWG